MLRAIFELVKLFKKINDFMDRVTSGDIVGGMEEAFYAAYDAMIGECGNEGQAAIIDKNFPTWVDAFGTNVEPGISFSANIDVEEFMATSEIWDAGEEAWKESIADSGLPTNEDGFPVICSSEGFSMGDLNVL